MAHQVTVDQATYARQCCPASALRQLSPDDVVALDRRCARALDDPDAEPRAIAAASSPARVGRC